jgi:hypothetical protein
MYEYEDIYGFLVKRLGVKRAKLHEEIHVSDELGCDGDDFSELMDAYAKRFAVDISAYLWYFHQGEEISMSLGASIFPPPNFRVERIPVTPRLLLESANAGRWLVEYPVHRMPRRRYDVLVDRVVALIVIATFLALIIHRVVAPAAGPK